MAPEEFAKFYPPLLAWISTHIGCQRARGANRRSRGFSRLPLILPKRLGIDKSRFLADPLPMPPLSSMGLAHFADFVRGNFDGITYIDTFFLKPS